MQQGDRLFRIKLDCPDEYREKMMKVVKPDFLTNYGQTLVQAELDRLEMVGKGIVPRDTITSRKKYNELVDQMNSIGIRLSKKATVELSKKYGIPGLNVEIEMVVPFDYKHVPEQASQPIGCLLGTLSIFRTS
ncbi:MAG TPA: hypothetical protein ENN67_00950 [Firmicutes bacterium]|nr:hypothetical protein [Bacillota bacterium]